MLRVWEMPVATLLAGGPSLLPLAPISNVRREHLPGVVERIKEQLVRLPAPESAKLWTATYVLVGLRYSRQLAAQLLEGVIGMEDSVTYQAIVEKGIEKGAVSEARKFFLRLAKKRLAHRRGGPHRCGRHCGRRTIGRTWRVIYGGAELGRSPSHAHGPSAATAAILTVESHFTGVGLPSAAPDSGGTFHHGFSVVVTGAGSGGPSPGTGPGKGAGKTCFFMPAGRRIVMSLSA